MATYTHFAFEAAAYPLGGVSTYNPWYEAVDSAGRRWSMSVTDEGRGIRPLTTNETTLLPAATPEQVAHLNTTLSLLSVGTVIYSAVADNPATIIYAFPSPREVEDAKYYGCPIDTWLPEHPFRTPALSQGGQQEIVVDLLRRQQAGEVLTVSTPGTTREWVELFKPWIGPRSQWFGFSSAETGHLQTTVWGGVDGQYTAWAVTLVGGQVTTYQFGNNGANGMGSEYRTWGQRPPADAESLGSGRWVTGGPTVGPTGWQIGTADNGRSCRVTDPDGNTWLFTEPGTVQGQ